MKKRRSVWVTWMCLMTVVVFIMAGCGKKATPENLFMDMGKKLKDVESVDAVLKMGLSMTDGTDSMEMSMDMDMQCTTKPQAAYLSGDIDINVSGMKFGTSIEAYQVKEDKEDVTYMNLMNQWMRITGDEEDAMNLEQIETMAEFADIADQFTLAEKTVKVEGEECFELTGTIKGELFSEILNQDFLDSMGAGDVLDEEDIEKMEIPCTVDISRSDILPVRMYLDMKSTMDSLYKDENEEVTVEEYYMEIIYKSFGDVGEIKVPDEVKEAAVDESGEDLDIEDSFGAGSGSVNQEPADQSDELGEDWDSFTVQLNETVLTFPCTIADAEASGMKFDSDYTPLDQMVEAGDYELGYLIDANDNEVMIELSNSSDEPKALGECLVTGIDVDDYSIDNGGVTVIFPGGIQIGMTKDAVIEKYGETDDVYEGESMHMYTWYDPVDFYKYCEIDFDPASGQVISMSLTCTEF